MTNTADEIHRAENGYRRAAEAGDLKAMYNLGVLLTRDGRSVEAKRWYRRAAEAGDVDAMFNLAFALDDHGDADGATKWLRRAAQAGDHEARMILTESGLGSLEPMEPSAPVLPSAALTEDVPAPRHAAEARKTPTRATWTVARRAGWVTLGLQLVALLVLSAGVWHSFDLSLDFAMFHQAWFGIAHGNLDPQTSFYNAPFWRNQAAFVIWLLAPLYYLYPHGITLLWVQDFAAVGAELVVFLWVLDAIDRRGQGQRLKRWLVPSVALVLLVANPWIYLTVVQDFHVETLAALFLVLAGRDLCRGRRGRTWVWVVAALSTGTVGGISIVALGVAALLAGSPTIRRQGLMLVAVGGAWLGMIVSLPADYGGGTNAYGYLRGPGPKSGVGSIFSLGTGLLFHPGRAVDMLTGRSGLVFDNLAPFGYIGVLWPWAGLTILVMMMLNALNVNPDFITPSFQNFATYVLGAGGSAFVVAWIISRRRPRARLVGFFLAAVLVVNAIVFSIPRLGNLPCGNRACSVIAPTVTTAAASELSTALSKTPSDAEVIASLGIAGRFAGRRDVYLLESLDSGSPPHIRVPVSTRTVVFVFAPYQGIETVNVIPAIPYVRDQLHAQPLTENAGVYAFLWHPPPGTNSVTLPMG